MSDLRWSALHIKPKQSVAKALVALNNLLITQKWDYIINKCIQCNSNYHLPMCYDYN